MFITQIYKKHRIKEVKSNGKKEEEYRIILGSDRICGTVAIFWLAKNSSTKVRVMWVY